MTLLDRIDDVNRALPGRAYFRFFVNDMPLGFIDTQLLDALPYPLFVIDRQNRRVDSRFAADARKDFEHRLTDFFKDFFAQRQLSGWRDEQYAVGQSFASPPVFLLERAALSFLGLTGYGVHINGYVEKNNGLFMWIGKRALDKPTSPGKLDQIVAGGQPHGISLMDNVIKECAEEASIPRHLAATAKPVSALSYRYDIAPIGLRPDVIFNYDLKLPADFTPQVNDNEVHSFRLYAMEELLTLLTDTQAFKFNSAVVIIDFAIRHGLISADHPDYLALHAGMHRRRTIVD